MKGYLHKRGSVWYSTVDLPRLPGEQRKQKCLRLGAGTKAQAQERERELLRKFDDGSWERESNMIVAELLETWLREKEQRLSAKTWESHESKIRIHLVPALGHVPLRKLRPKHIVDAYAAIRRKGTLSAQTHVHLHRILHAAFNYGKKTLKVLRENPAADIDAPRADGPAQSTMSEQQVRLILEAAKGSRLEIPVLVAVLTGVRRSELLGLTWSNVDLERGLLSITNTLEHSRRLGVRLRARTKTKGSRRVIPLAQPLIDALRSHKAAQDRERSALGDAYCENDLAFCNPDGSLWPPDTLSKQFADIAALVGLRGKFRLQDARHAFASITLKNGTSIKEVSALLGHSSPVLTLSTYAHTMEGMGRAAVNDLATSLLEGSQSP